LELRTRSTGEDSELEYFLGSVKIMLIATALSAFISMLVAWVITLLFAFIRGRRAAVATSGDAEAKPASRPAGNEPGKAG